MIKKLLASVLCMAIASTASAAHWYYLTGSKSDAMVVDVDSIENKGNIKGAWVLYATFNAEYKESSYTVIWTELDCKDKKLRINEAFSYTELGKPTGHTEGPYMWQRFPPGTRGSALYSCVCKNKNRDILISDSESTHTAFQRLMLAMIFSETEPVTSTQTKTK